MRAPFCATILAVSLIFTVAAQASTPEKRCVPLMEHLTKLPIHIVKGGEYAGLSEVGVKEMYSIRGKLLETEKIANTQLYSLNVVVDLLPKIAAANQSTLFYGGHGSGKSLSANVILNSKNLGVTLVNPMTTKEVVIGGPSRAEMEAGNFSGANWQGAAITKSFQVLDEFTNGNGSFLGSLGSMLNEKKEFSGAIPLDVSNVQSWIFITNATLPEIQKLFVESGNGAFGPAFTGRVNAKFYFHNWGDSATRIKIAELNSKKAKIEALSSSDPSLKEHLLLKTVPSDLNYIALREFAQNAFEITPETRAFIQDLLNQIKLRYRAYNDEVQIKLDEQDKSTAPYYPSVDLSDRIAGKAVEDMVVMSVALDFLKSDMAANPKRLAQMVKKPIKINPISAWRLFPVLTTVLARNSTVFDPFTQQVHFAVERRDKHTIKLFDKEHMRNTFAKKVDVLNFEHQEREREIFNEVFQTLIKEKVNIDKEIAEASGIKEGEFDLDNILVDADMEFSLLAAGSENSVQVKSSLKPNE